MKAELYIVGTGAHGRKVYECAVKSGWSVKAFVDSASNAYSPIEGIAVLSENEVLSYIHPSAIFVAIGDSRSRANVVKIFEAKGWQIPSLIHPQSSVSDFARIDRGVFVAAGAVIEGGTRVGYGAIIDIGVFIDHDCTIEPFMHVRSSSALAPRSKIGESVS